MTQVQEALTGLTNLIIGIDGGENDSQRQQVAFNFLCTIRNSTRLADDREIFLKGKIEELEQRLRQAYPSDGIHAIADERRRQMEKLGWTAEADDEWVSDQLNDAAVAYLLAANETPHVMRTGPGDFWPWSNTLFRPESPMRCLEKAGALIAAEIDRRKRLGE